MSRARWRFDQRRDVLSSSKCVRESGHPLTSVLLMRDVACSDNCGWKVRVIEWWERMKSIQESRGLTDKEILAEMVLTGGDHERN